jgi:hypothetical protein
MTKDMPRSVRQVAVVAREFGVKPSAVLDGSSGGRVSMDELSLL